MRWVNLAINVDDIVIRESANHLADRVCLTDVSEEGVAHALALGRAFHDAGDVHEGHGRRQDALGAKDLRQAVKAMIRQLHEANVRLNRGERVVGRQNVGTGQGIKQRGLANVRQADDSKCKTHRGNPNARGIFSGKMVG